MRQSCMIARDCADSVHVETSPVTKLDSSSRRLRKDGPLLCAVSQQTALCSKFKSASPALIFKPDADLRPHTSGKQTNAPTDRKLVDKPTGCAARSQPAM